MSSNKDEPTVKELKDSLDIIEVARLYESSLGKVLKVGVNYTFENDRSIILSPSKQIITNFNGSLMGGSVLDMIMYFENINEHKAINRLKELSSLETYIINPALQERRFKEEKDHKTVDFKKLNEWGMQELQAVAIHKPVECFDSKQVLTHIIIPQELEKLFETKQFPAKYIKKIDYMFLNLIGWNKHFNCPSILIKDTQGQIVDLIAYRPNKPEKYDKWSNPKYLYKNSHNRGENFLYPFKKEVEKMLFKISNKDKYVVIGEGIKNGLNALLYSVPYITLESTSNKLQDRLIYYIRDLHEKGYDILGMFDGDKAGKKAYENTLEQLGIQFNNFLDFDSGTDFVEYLQSGANDE